MDPETEQTLVEIVMTISELAFNLQMNPLPTSALPQGETYAASVHILGDWNGSVLVEMSKELAERATLANLDLTADETLEFYHVQQFMQELVNMTGGNLKPMLGEKCALSTPKCFKSTNFSGTIPGSQIAVDLAFEEASSGFLGVKLMKAHRDPSDLIRELNES